MYPELKFLIPAAIVFVISPVLVLAAAYVADKAARLFGSEEE